MTDTNHPDFLQGQTTRETLTCSRSATCSGSAPYLLPSGHRAPGSSARIRNTPIAPGCIRAIFFSSHTVSNVVRSTLDAAAIRRSRGRLQQLARMILSAGTPKLNTISICKQQRRLDDLPRLIQFLPNQPARERTCELQSKTRKEVCCIQDAIIVTGKTKLHRPAIVSESCVTRHEC